MRSERGATMVEMMVVVAATAMLIAAGTGFAKNAPLAAQHSVTVRGAPAALQRVRSLAASSGATLLVAPSGSGSRITIYAGWTTNAAAQIETLLLDEPVGLSVNGGGHSSAVISVRRDGSWFATVDGGTPVDCAATLLFGPLIVHGPSAGAPAPDGVELTCAEIAA